MIQSYQMSKHDIYIHCMTHLGLTPRPSLHWALHPGRPAGGPGPGPPIPSLDQGPGRRRTVTGRASILQVGH